MHVGYTNLFIILSRTPLNFFVIGIKIVGGKSTVGGSDYGIFVKKILAGGRAEAEG